jgi:hypothetical protein
VSVLADRVTFGHREQLHLRMLYYFDGYATPLGVNFGPVSHETKKPYHSEWTTRRFSVEDFQPKDNVGGLWACARSGICALGMAERMNTPDLVRELAAALADDLCAAR